jgi:hypothetical protein
MTNLNSPLTLSCEENTPANYRAVFWLKVFDSSRGYADSLEFSLVLNPVPVYALGEHNVGNVVFTLSNSGRYGLGEGSITPAGGKGFRFPKTGEDNLFEGALLVAKSREQVMDAARDENGMSSENDFLPEGNLTLSSPGISSDQDGLGIFSDNGAEYPIGLEIVQRSFAFANPPDDDYVILEYTIKNKSIDTLENIYPGLFFDWDINLTTPKDDLAGRDTISDISFVYQYDSTSSIYLTVYPLNHPPASCKLIDNQLYLYDGFTEEEKYLFLSNDTLLAADTVSFLYAGDWSMVSSCGPFVIPPQENIVVAVAVIAGENLYDLKENIKSARLKYYDMKTEVESEEHSIPNVYSLGQNYPNPFNPTTTIPFRVNSSQLMVHSPIHTTLVIYNILGQKVKTLVEDEVLPGIYEIVWDGKNDKGSEVTSGIYFYRLETDGFKQTKKMILLR